MGILFCQLKATAGWRRGIWAKAPGWTGAARHRDSRRVGPRSPGRPSLQAGLPAARKRASDALGEQARTNPDSAPPDINSLIARIAQTEQGTVGLRIQLADRDDEFAAAHAANRETKTGDTPQLILHHTSRTLLSLTAVPKS